MTNELRDIYEANGLLGYYFDEATPCDLYRAQNDSAARKNEPLIFPNPGFPRKSGPDRPPDVKVVERGGKKFVLGCRCAKGLYRGVSTFDRINPILKGFTWYRLPKGSEIPPGLAITQDDDLPNKSNHYTIAPKDDMLFEHFVAMLNVLAQKLQKL